jgi:hypothetical protein
MEREAPENSVSDFGRSTRHAFNSGGGVRSNDQTDKQVEEDAPKNL